MSLLKNHPFAVETHFESSIVLTYAIPKSDLVNLIPECLELDTFDDKWAFVALAIVKTKKLRPKGFPSFLGNDFILTGYRIFVRYKTSAGKNLRGLYIIKSETDKTKMAFLGNIFTHYSYTKTDINFIKENTIIKIKSEKSGLDIEINLQKEEVTLPKNSPFQDWKEARRFAGPLPFTFTYNPEKKEVLIIEGVREKWIPKPIEIIKQKSDFINQFSFYSIILANAFIINDIPYYWKKGKIDRWIQQ
ncbi:MAG: DUF2071 domain-containing protein [Flavobacterium sp.]